MKILIISLLLLFTVNAQTNYYLSYVDSTRSEDGLDGLSWSTAWKYLGTGTPGAYGGVDWTVLEGGDTLFIDGGTLGDTTVYWARFGGQAHYIGKSSGQPGDSTDHIIYSGNPVVVCMSQETGHNGTAIFSIKNEAGTNRGLLQIVNIENIKVTGLTFRDIRNPYIIENGQVSATLSIWGTASPTGGTNTFENNTIIKSPFQAGMGFSGYNIVMRNNYFEDPYNVSPLGAQDMIGGDAGMGTIIDGNTFISRNNYTMIKNTTGTGVTISNSPKASLTDSSIPTMETDYHKFVGIICGNYEMVVDSNNADTFYGDSTWYNRTSGLYNDGAPADGTAWRMETAHRDGFQFAQFWGNPPNSDGYTRVADTLTTIISNNTVVDLGTHGIGWNGFLYTSYPNQNQWFYIYNNIFCNSEEVDGGNIFLYSSADTIDDGSQSQYFLGAKVMNNTFIYKGADSRIDGEPLRYAGNAVIGIENFDSVEVKNNLFVCDSTLNHIITASDNGHNDFDYNRYAFDAYNQIYDEPDQWFYMRERSPAYDDLDAWHALGQDVNSDTLQSSMIVWANKYEFTAEDYRTTTGSDSGVNLYNTYTWLRYDAAGVERPSTGAWDIGAVQYMAGTADTTGTVTFTSVSNAELNSYHIAYGVVSGLDSTAHVYTATSDSFAVGYPYTLGLGVQSVENGDTIAISNIASGSYSTANINYVILSGTSRSFTVTTKAEPIVPSGNGGVVRGSDGKIWRTSDGKIIKVTQ